MAGNITKKYTVELNLDVKTADVQVKKLATNINNMWADMGKAGNKFAVLKDLADYLGQIDDKIASLKNLDLDLFNKIFGMDGAKINAALKEVMEPILKSPEQIADAINLIQTKLEVLKTDPKAKGTAASIREVGEALNSVYKLMGQTPPIDIAEQLTGGKTAEKLALVTKIFDNLKIEWKNVLATVNTGGGESGGFSGMAEGVRRSAQDIEGEIDHLEQQINRLGSMQKDIQKIVGNIKQYDTDGSIFSPDTKFTIQDVTDAIKEFGQVKKEFESFKGDKSSIEYFEILSKYMQQSAKVGSIYSMLTDVDNINNRLYKKMKTIPLKNGKGTYADVLKKVGGSADDALSSDLSESFLQYAGSIDGQIDKISARMTTLEDQLERVNTATSEVFSGGIDNKIAEVAGAAQKQVEELTEAMANLRAENEKLQNELDVAKSDLNSSDMALSEVIGEKYKIEQSQQAEVEKAIEDWNNLVDTIERGIESSETAHYYEGQLSTMIDYIDRLHELGLVSEETMGKIQAEYHDVSDLVGAESYASQAYNLTDLLRELHDKATLTDDQAELTKIIAERQQLIDFAEREDKLDEDILETQRAITLEIAKRAGVKEDDYDDWIKENGVLEQKLELLKEIAYEYGNTITQKQRNRLSELDDKEMSDTGLTAKEEDKQAELFDVIQTADRAIEDLGSIYEKIVLTLNNGKKIEINPDDAGLRALAKFDDEGYGESYNGQEITDVLFVRKQEQTVIEQTNDALREQAQIQQKINVEAAQAKLNELDEVGKDIDSLYYGNEMTDIRIGKYTEQLNTAEEAIKSLGEQELLTAQQIEHANEVIADSRQILKLATTDNERAREEAEGKYDYTYSGELAAAEYENDELRKEISRLESDNEAVRHDNQQLADQRNDLEKQLNEANQRLVEQREDVVQEDTFVQEATKAEELLQKIKDIKQAVDEKTAAFREEADVVDGVVGQEILALGRLREAITDIEQALDLVFADRKLNLPKITSEQQTRQDKANVDSTSSLLQNIDQVLNQILTVLQKFTGIEAENKNSVKIKEPAADVNVGASDAYELLANKLPDGIATESTLEAIRGSVEQIGSLLKVGDDANTNVKDTEDLSNVAVATDVVADNLKDIVYHAGDLSNIANTLKTLPLGNFKPQKMESTFNGFTGLYTTENFEFLSGNEWEGAPISTIDLSQYKMFDARSDELATKVKHFFNDLNSAIYGYLNDWDYDTHEMVQVPNALTIEELYNNFQQVFNGVEMDFKAFQDFIEQSSAIVKGHSFNEIELPDMDMGVSKFSAGTSLQDVSHEVFNSDTFQTQFLKKLGFEGIDLRGTKHNNAYSGGTVVFDIKPESLKSVNEKWTDVAHRLYPENDFWYSPEALEREEKRRQLAFETAKAYSQQAQTEQQITDEKKQQVAIDGMDSADIQHESTEMQQLAAQVRDVEAAVKDKTNAFTQEGTVVNQVVQQEIAALQRLIDKLNAVKAAVEDKTDAFIDEGAAVKDIVPKETAQQKQDDATNKKKTSNDTSSKNSKDTNVIARLDDDSIQNSADSLRRLVTSTESLGVAFRGVYNDGSRVVYDVLDGDVIRSYAVELDKATGNVYKMELSERELVNAMQSVNKAAKQNKELGGILDHDDVNKSATVITNYLSAKNDLNKAVANAWTKAQQNGGIIDQTDLDNIYTMSQEVMRLGTTIQYEYKRISNIKDTGGIFKALGGNMADDVETRMRQYANNIAKTNTQSVANVQYDSATKAMTADLVDLSGHITKVHLQYNELFDGVQTTSLKGVQAIDKTVKKMNQLKQSVSSALGAGLIDKNLAQYKKYDHAVNSLAEHIQKIQNGDIAFDDAAIHKWEVLRKTIMDAGDELVKIADINRAAQQTTTGVFEADKKQSGKNFANYNESVKEAAYLTQKLKDELSALDGLLQDISNSDDLSAWNDDFKALQIKISKAKEDYSLREKGKLKSLGGQLSSINFKKLGIDINRLAFDDEDQSKIVKLYKELEIEITKCSKAVQRGEEISTASIEANIAALNKEIQTYKTKHNIVDGVSRSRSAPKTTDRVNAQSKFNSIESRSQAYIAAGSTVVDVQLKEYKKALDELVTLQNQFKVGQVLTTDQEVRFTELKNKCNDYYKALKKVLDTSDELKTIGSEIKPIMDDVSLEGFDDRANELKAYVREVYGTSASIEKLNGDATKLAFTVKNGDGTIKHMIASLNAAGTQIVSVAGDTEKVTSKFGKFFDTVKNKFSGLLTYAAARFGIDEVFQVLRRGIEDVRAIDSALTELKKVTNGTKAEYDAFLETMASTGSRIGATVSDLTTMAAEWAKLGYTMQESATLAESTAVLLNVSEFTDATAASEALISTMQAFGYGAEESMHVVDILNEVGKLIARR